MKKLELIINKGIDTMASVFTSKELFSWILKTYPKQFHFACKKYILLHQSKKKLIDHIYNLIRKSCKIEKIFILQIPNQNMKYVNFTMVKFGKKK